MRKRTSRFGALCFGALSLAAAGPALSQEFEIPVVLPLTGNAAFLGQGERQALEIEQKVMNDASGAGGTHVRFVFHDDQSSPQTAVQVTSQIVSSHPAEMIGSSIVAMCNAMAPLVAKGPVDYCLSPGVHPKGGSFVFTGFISTHDLAQALIAYFRGKGLTRLAMITSTDASGRDGADGFHEAMNRAENKAMTIAADLSFAPTDVSVSAQIERIKASRPQAIIVWTSGAPFTTVLRGVSQAGLDVPVATTDANMTLVQMQQYEKFLPKEALFMSSEWPAHPDSMKLPDAVNKAQAVMFKAYKAAGQGIDQAAISAWDPGMLEIAAVQKVGVHATPEQIRAFIAAQTDWAGANGIYNFSNQPQRGLDVNNSVVTRWDQGSKSWITVSQPGGAPL